MVMRAARWLVVAASLGGGLLACNAILGNHTGQGYDAGVDELGDDASTEGGATCTPGATKLCTGDCVELDDPRFGCGAPSCAACSFPRARPRCESTASSQACAIGFGSTDCQPGYANCDEDAGNGCEVELSSPSHCGRCGQPCGGSLPFCSPTADGGFVCSEVCGAPSTVCTVDGGARECVDLSSNRAHCGTCNQVCPPPPADSDGVCRASKCDFECRREYHRCPPASALVVDKTPHCASDRDPTQCGAGCVDCTLVGQGTTQFVCQAGACAIKACQRGWADCNGKPADGCEVNRQNDPENCGECGRSCKESGGRCCRGQCTNGPSICPF